MTDYPPLAAPAGPPRFMTLVQVGQELNISSSQTYALVRSGELPAIQIGGRGQWRVERSRLEDYITEGYARTTQAVRRGLSDEDLPRGDPAGGQAGTNRDSQSGV